MPNLSQIDPYDQILKNMLAYPSGLPLKDQGISDAFQEYIHLLFTPEEAKTAQYLAVRPVETKIRRKKWIMKIGQKPVVQSLLKRRLIRHIAKKIGKSRQETKKLLDAMVHNGIIQDIGGYSYFISISHLLNIGFKHSKAFERLGKRGAELFQEFFVQDGFYRRYQSSDHGTSMTRVVPVGEVVETHKEILNIEEIHHVFDRIKEPIVVTDCPCRKRMELLGKRECHGKYAIEQSCFQCGVFGEYFLRAGQGKQISRDQAHVLVNQYAKQGLVFTTENSSDPEHLVICCCCPCCCSLLQGITRFDKKNEFCTAKSNYIAKYNATTCKGCGLCATSCPFHAISIDGSVAHIHTEKCYGCGICSIKCPQKAITLIRHERSMIEANIPSLMQKIYDENRS